MGGMNKGEYIPGLDGVRALAIAAVIGFHAEMAGLAPGGFLGVDVFFVLSGFLITSLLLRERLATGGVRLGAFYAGRLRRLLPAMLAMVVASALAALWWAPDALWRQQQDVPAALLYVSNWWQIHSGQSYFEMFGRPPLLQHLWSLAIEEQFYLAWPLLLLAAARLGGRRGVLVVAAVLAGCSAGWMALLAMWQGVPEQAGPDRLYLGTDTHSMGLLMGAALACVWNPWTHARPASAEKPADPLATATALPQPTHPQASRKAGARKKKIRSAGHAAARAQRHGVASATVKTDAATHAPSLPHPWRLELPGWAGLAVVLAAVVWASEADAGLYRWGFAAVSLATCLLIVGATAPRTLLGRLLGLPVLRYIGQRSYGLYLWHWPVFVLLRPGHELPGEPWLALCVRLGVTLALTEVSYRWVEQPVRSYPVRPWQRRGWAGFGVAAALGCAVVAQLYLTHVSAPAQVATATAQPPVTPGQGEQPAAATPDTPPAPETPPASPPPVPREQLVLTAVGDSVLLGTQGYLTRNLSPVVVDAEAGRQGTAGFQRIRALRSEDRLADAVLMHLGTNGYLYESGLHEILQELSDRRLVVVMNVHAPRRWIEGNNRMLQRVIPRYPNARLVDWHAVAVAHPEYFGSDGVHLTGRGMHAYVNLVRGVLNPEAASDAAATGATGGSGAMRLSPRLSSAAREKADAARAGTEAPPGPHAPGKAVPAPAPVTEEQQPPGAARQSPPAPGEPGAAGDAGTAPGHPAPERPPSSI